MSNVALNKKKNKLKARLIFIEKENEALMAEINELLNKEKEK